MRLFTVRRVLAALERRNKVGEKLSLPDRMRTETPAWLCLWIDRRRHVSARRETIKAKLKHVARARARKRRFKHFRSTDVKGNLLNLNFLFCSNNRSQRVKGLRLKTNNNDNFMPTTRTRMHLNTHLYKHTRDTRSFLLTRAVLTAVYTYKYIYIYIAIGCRAYLIINYIHTHTHMHLQNTHFYVFTCIRCIVYINRSPKLIASYRAYKHYKLRLTGRPMRARHVNKILRDTTYVHIQSF